ncbi:hypothetical protein [Kitasatospora sp. NPDC048407]|uniref:hypothetical protein n=1 Tax=Kitasatospora sp. NPDC048407 TaxID=3364051 RepID=UPI003714AA11
MNPLLRESGGAVAERIVPTALRVPATLARFGRRCELWQFDTDATVEDVRLIICMGAVRLALGSSAATDSDDAAESRPPTSPGPSAPDPPTNSSPLAPAISRPVTGSRPIASSPSDSTSGPAAIRWERLSVLVRDFTATYDQTHRP